MKSTQNQLIIRFLMRGWKYEEKQNKYDSQTIQYKGKKTKLVVTYIDENSLSLEFIEDPSYIFYIFHINYGNQIEKIVELLDSWKDKVHTENITLMLKEIATTFPETFELFDEEWIQITSEGLPKETEVISIIDMNLSIFKQKTFWTDYFYINDKLSGRFPPLMIQFPVINEIGFFLEIQKAMNVNVLLYHPNLTRPVLLGYDNDPHNHPHIFRWQEFEDFCHFFSNKYYLNRNLLTLLFYRFVAFEGENHIEKIVHEIRSAYCSLNIFSEPEIDMFFYNTRLRHALDKYSNYYWLKDPKDGWIYKGEYVYSQRPYHNQTLQEVLNIIYSQKQLWSNS